MSDPCQSFPWRTLLTALVLCLGGSVHLGIQLSNLNPDESVFHEFINETSFNHYGHFISDYTYRLIWTAVLNLQTVGSIFGVLPLMKLSENIGRRNTFYVSSIFTLSGLVLQTFSKLASSYELLAIGRFMTGIGSGLAPPLEGMYLNEISPIHLRGFFGSMVGISLEMGFIIGAVLGLPVIFGTESLWPWMIAFEIPPVILLLSVLPFLPESPRYLLSRGDETGCRKALKYFGHTNIEYSVNEIQSDLQSQRSTITWNEVWRKTHIRKAALLGLAAAILATCSGITAIDYFSTNILIGAGLSPWTAQYATVAIFVLCFLSAVLGGFIIDKIGRRPLLLLTTISLVLSNTCLMVSSILYNRNGVGWVGYLGVVSCSILCISFGLGPSILQWTVTSEMVPQNARSTVQFLVMIIHKISALIFGTVFFPLQGVIGPLAFLLFIVPMCVLFMIFIKWFPETKEKTVVEVMHSLGYKANGKNWKV